MPGCCPPDDLARFSRNFHRLASQFVRRSSLAPLPLHTRPGQMRIPMHQTDRRFRLFAGILLRSSPEWAGACVGVLNPSSFDLEGQRCCTQCRRRYKAGERCFSGGAELAVQARARCCRGRRRRQSRTAGRCDGRSTSRYHGPLRFPQLQAEGDLGLVVRAAHGTCPARSSRDARGRGPPLRMTPLPEGAELPRFTLCQNTDATLSQRAVPTCYLLRHYQL